MHKLCIIVARRGVMGCAHTYGSDFRCVCACIAQHSLESFHDNLRGNVFSQPPALCEILYSRVPAIASWPLCIMRGLDAYLPLPVGALPEIQNLWVASVARISHATNRACKSLYAYHKHAPSPVLCLEGISVEREPGTRTQGRLAFFL